MYQLQNKLQWSENQVNESKKAQDDLQDKLSSATKQLKAQKEKLNEAWSSRSEADKNLEDAKEKLAELQVCPALMAYSHCTGPRMEPRSMGPGQGRGPIVLWCASRIPHTASVPGPVQCEKLVVWK